MDVFILGYPLHEDLIARGIPSGAVRVSRTLVGNETIGVLYNFVHDGWVLNYQSGFLYEHVDGSSLGS